jgi:uncharacterized membrane protein YccC
MRDWISARAEEVLGRLTQELLGNTTVHAAVGRAFEARGKATQAQETAMGLLNIPTAADIARLTRRVRSVSQRLDAIDDALRRLEDGVRQQAAPIMQRLDAIEQELASSARLLSELDAARPDNGVSVSRDQERLRVEETLVTSKSGKGKRRKRRN